MARPEKRWQLLLVADDGRIIPFKRIKGIAVTLSILLVILMLVCAGLGWRLAAEKVRHRRTLEQLTDANRQARHYKSEHELIAAELVLAEARMQKAGLTVSGRQERMPQQTPLKPVEAESVRGPTVDDRQKETESIATATPAAADQPALAPAETPPAKAVDKPAPEAASAAATENPERPMVALGDLEIKHDTGKKTLLARFRVKNTGPRSSPVAGRCVVVLANDQMDPGAWQVMPDATLLNGEPDGVRGQAFRISRFKDMEIYAIVKTDPSSFDTASIYVFDTTGAKILKKDFSIDLPAPKPDPKPVSAPARQPASVPEATTVPAMPVEPASDTPPANPQTPNLDSDMGIGNPPPAPPAEAGDGAVPPPVPIPEPVDDPSLTEDVGSAMEDDARSRF